MCRLDVSRDGEPFTAMNVEVAGIEVAKVEKHGTEYADPFWRALLVLVPLPATFASFATGVYPALSGSARGAIPSRHY